MSDGWLHCARDRQLQTQRPGALLRKGVKSGIQAQHAERLRLILARLTRRLPSEDMALPGLRLHQLKGDRKGTWSVTVSGNWRVTFKFHAKEVTDVDYEDYH